MFMHGACALWLVYLYLKFQAFTPKLHHLRCFTACLVWPDSTTFKKLLLTNSLSALYLRRSIFFFFSRSLLILSYYKLASRLVLRLARSILAWRTFFSTGAQLNMLGTASSFRGGFLFYPFSREAPSARKAEINMHCRVRSENLRLLKE